MYGRVDVEIAADDEVTSVDSAHFRIQFLGRVARRVEGPAPATSPDGRTLAFSAIDGEGHSQIWLRPMSSSDAHALPGTERASAPVFWSPDGRSLTFASRSLARLT